MPGQTTWQEAQSFLNTIASNSQINYLPQGDSFIAYYQFPVSEDIYPYYPQYSFEIDNNIVKIIEVTPGNLPTYSLPSLLIQYGLPSEVWLKSFRDAPERPFPFYVVLFYAQQGILANYATNAIVEKDRVLGCFWQEPPVALALWSPKQLMTFVEVTRHTIATRVEEWDTFPIPLEEGTGMEIEEFYQIFKDPTHSRCLDTPAELWP